MGERGWGGRRWERMKLQCIHAHYDDYEFAVAGAFEMWKRMRGGELRTQVVVCTDGEAGHHCLSRAETGRVRLQEQLASAQVGGYAFEPLRLPNGSVPREAGLEMSVEVLAAFWQVIRQFGPDYLFCPPLATDPLAGIHLDHVAVAEAVRKVAYLLNVPHAFTPEFPPKEAVAQPCPVPVILNVYDGYLSSSNQYDFAVDVEAAFPLMAEMAYCHRSQICEWLPWVGRHRMEPPQSLADWKRTLRQRFLRRNRELGIDSTRVFEIFTVTAWGEIPSLDQLLSDLPGVVPEYSNLPRLGERLKRWRGE